MVLMLATSAVLMVTPIAGACEGSRLVSLGQGCIDLPCEYRVVLTTTGIDTAAGFVEPPERNWRVNWLSGMWAESLAIGEGRQVVWRKHESIGGQDVSIGLVDEAGKRFFALSKPRLQLLVPEAVPSALELLRALGARLRGRNEYVACEDPQKAAE